MKTRELIDIMQVADRLKDAVRHCYTPGGRRESVAEHSWRMTLMALFIGDEFPEADMDKVIRMCLIHDLGEAFTGDIPTFIKTESDETREENLLYDWVASLPEPYCTDMRALYDEMEARETLEAKIYKALDGMEALIAHNDSDISTWEENEYSLQMIYADDKIDFSPFMKKLRQTIREDSILKIEMEKENGKKIVFRARYLGVQGYGTDILEGVPAEQFNHRFEMEENGKKTVMTLPLAVPRCGRDGRPSFELQNKLQEGREYDVVVVDGTAIDVRRCDESGSAMEGASESGSRSDEPAEAIPQDMADAAETAGAMPQDMADAAETAGAMPQDTGDASESAGAQTDRKAPESKGIAAPVPGERTLKNFLQTSLSAAGHALYVFGGGWNWQDTGAGPQTSHIGVAPEWKRFFDEQNASYTFRDPDNDPAKKDPPHSYYPYGGWNQYYYAGLDCSGYAGWTIYNVMQKDDGRTGYVWPSGLAAAKLSEQGWGERTGSPVMASAAEASEEKAFEDAEPSALPEEDVLKESVSEDATPEKRQHFRFRPGDMFSMDGHVWISFGTCSDGSILIAHSTPSLSRSGQPGGGVQLSAVSQSEEDTGCEAYRLADAYMSRFCPEWYERYQPVVREYAKFTAFTKEQCGKFSWNLTGENGGLTDPDGVAEMTPEEVLRLLCGGSF